MKSAVADPETPLYCARIVAVTGEEFHFAWYPHNVKMSNGQFYLSDPFFQPTDLASTSDLSPSVFDSQGFFDAAGITRDQLLSGLLDNSKGYYFKSSWTNPIEDEEPLKKTILGAGQIDDEVYTLEHMNLKDAMSQTVGSTVVSKCTWTLFDETLDGDIIATDRSRCTGPRAATDGPLLADYEVTGTVTHVTSNGVWRDSGRSEAEGYFNFGSVKWLTGLNAGLRSTEIKSSLADGTITTHLAAYYTVQVGDTYKASPGCDHLRDGDCFTKFNNNINCNHMADVITKSEYTKHGTNQ
ncbi:MAG: hypothetical protein COB36_10780 [Alphaproteobacteria bacterium]|nr:MAG: hypothetical protein COB36_10780 [Alphaproteobacteria bacterium]